MHEILINASINETRIALLTGGKLKALSIERYPHHSRVGNIYQGKVLRLAPGMQAAFIDIKQPRAGFLHVTDLLGAKSHVQRQAIGDFLKEGQSILVQVSKDAWGMKGPRLTARLSIPSRYFVLTPGVPEIHISRKMADLKERERLQTLLEANSLQGCIVRTVAQGVLEEQLIADYRSLAARWEDLNQQAKDAPVGTLIYEEPTFLFRLIRDLAPEQVEIIRIDEAALLQKVQTYAAQNNPLLVSKIHSYDSAVPIFDLYFIDDEIQRLLARKVYLRSGGYLIIDQTEALTTIDVNTGSFLGRAEGDPTVYQTNLEAAHAIAMQIRLRNLAGIIIVDLIDMAQSAHREAILNAFKKALADDPMPVEVHELTSLGLLQLTRKRMHESLSQILCEPCPMCERKGFVRSLETVCHDIFREIKRLDSIYGWDTYQITASDAIIHYLKQAESLVKEWVNHIQKPVYLKKESYYLREQFNIGSGKQ